MPTFLFWNLQKKPLGPQVERLAAEHGVDVVVLAEPDGCADLTLAGYDVVPGSGRKLSILSRSARWRLLKADELDAWAGYRVTPAAGPPYNLFAAHLPSKLRADQYDQLNTACELRDDILAAEVDHDARTVLVGDLNGNPFDPALVTVTSLHGVSSKEVARRESRAVRGRQYLFLYNPMWGVFGDRTPGPPGTYYRAASQAVNYYWDVFDQVLLRPALMDNLTELRVLTEVDGVSLLTTGGVPDQAVGSDHLPLLFRLDW